MVTVVEGDPKAPFSIATTLRCREGRHYFPWIAPLTLYQYLIMLNVKQGIKYHFFSLTRPEIEPQSRGLLANTLTTAQISYFVGLLYTWSIRIKHFFQQTLLIFLHGLH